MTSTFTHEAFLYHSGQEYIDGVGAFLSQGVAADEAVLVSVPHDSRALLENSFNGSGEHIRLVDMAEIARNPARLIPFISDFVHSHEGRSVRVVGEPIWEGRTEEEIQEVARQESLLNLAFADTALRILCPYRVGNVRTDYLDGLSLTHEALIAGGMPKASDSYLRPATAPASRPLPAPPEGSSVLHFREPSALADLRRAVRQSGLRAGVPPDRLGDMEVAVTEVAANAMEHGGRGGALHIWDEGTSFICQLSGGGQIIDPLAGLRRLSGPARGNGLWLVNHLCDLVELHSDSAGTTVRLRVWKTT